jgi:hypothetical protein
MVTKHNKEIIMSMRIIPMLIAATFIAGFGMGDYASKRKYELEMLARSSRLLVIQEQIAMMILQDRGELPFKKMLATDDQIKAAKAASVE